MLSAFWRRDDGMNVFEVVFAAFIMFVVLTGVLGLVASSTSMGIDAKQRNLISNTIASRIEYVRSLPFSQVDITGTGDGVIPPTETFTVSGMTVTIAYQIREGSGGTKEIRVTATVSSPGRKTITTTAYSVIRDRDQDMTQFTGVKLGPSIQWTSSTPHDGSVVYDNLVWSPAGVLDLEAHAEPSAEGLLVTKMEMYLIGSATELVYLKDGTSTLSDTAQWDFGDGVTSADASFRWHTKQVGADGERTVADGWQTVRARAWDSDGNSRSVDRAFYVDNDAPGDAGTPTATADTDALATARWGPGAQATTYDIVAYRQTPTGNGSYTDSASWETSPAISTANLMTNVPTYRFSRYVITALARSPRLSAPNAVPSEPFVSRPVANGSARCYNVGKTPAVSATLTVSPPTFLCTGDTTYAFSYRAGTGGTWTSLGTSVTPGSQPIQYVSAAIPLVKVLGQWQPLYYRCLVTFTPGGSMGGTSQQTMSNVIGPSTNLAGTTTSLSHAEW